jgi:hypothetical protein
LCSSPGMRAPTSWRSCKIAWKCCALLLSTPLAGDTTRRSCTVMRTHKRK